ncbi:hypothetical protein [Salinibacter ruber]|uniref:Glycosyltransferase RgtA/B/C/D-like domain-containing protein n=1 Tax=Salinibacter ruber TaxID=146919 RepID=A0A9X2TGU1_9BACT|nr:hypothetical protein [Salinibacter ruber]MCS3662260.1 hypothetical protein [Salinibacter ruber]MCS3712015.1 hypothetical protein [Salinibacter ruber]
MADNRKYLLLIFLIISFSISYFYCGTSHGDDTFIYMEYVDNALNGEGFVFNEGEKSYGVTSSLWTFLMFPFAWIFGNTVIVWKVVSSLLFGVGVTIIGSVLLRYAKWHIAAILTITVALAPHVLRWSGTGMENGLVVLGWGVALLTWENLETRDSRSRPWTAISAGASWALLPFVRPELGLFVVSIGLITVWQFVRNDRFTDAVRLSIAGLVTGVGTLLLAWESFGSLLPQTAAAKGTALHQSDPLYGLTQSLKIFLSGTGPLFLLLLFLSIFRTKKVKSVWTGAVLFSVLIAIGYLGSVNQLVSTRYASYLSLPVILTTVYIISKNLSFSTVLVKAALILQLATSIALMVYLFPATRTSEAESFSPVVERFEQIRSVDSPRVALTEVGAFGFYSDAYIIDLVGLTDRKTLQWLQKNTPNLTDPNLEDLLIARQATHYVEYDEKCRPPQFNALKPNLLMEADVERNNLSGGSVHRPHLCIYSLKSSQR